MAYTCTRILLGLMVCTMQIDIAYAKENCPVTLPTSSPVPAAGPTSQNWSWYGSEALAAKIPVDGKWMGMGPEHNYGDKFWWWRLGYEAAKETAPDLVVSGIRLDGSAPEAKGLKATNAYGPGWNQMLVGMEFPASGCWQVVGKYRGRELTMILQVGE